MIYTVIGIFSLAVILGILLLSNLIRDKPVSGIMALAHGSIAAIGLVLLIIYAFYHHPSPLASIILFCLAAGGGMTMAYHDLTGKKIPKWLGIGHGLIAISAFVCLLIFAI